MTDSELTAAAARAAGLELEPDSDHPDGSHWMKSGTCLPDGQCVWHPLRNDMHAFRLAVKLDITLCTPGSKPAAKINLPGQTIYYEDDCPRRAIVLAAAALAT